MWFLHYVTNFMIQGGTVLQSMYAGRMKQIGASQVDNPCIKVSINLFYLS
jgi:hypothetical protein